MGIDKFSGVDLSEKDKGVFTSSAQMAENMFVNEAAQAQKRFGFKSLYRAESGAVHGIYKYYCEDESKAFYILHENDKLYKAFKNADGKYEKSGLIYENIADKESKGFCFGGALYIMCDGYYKIAYEEAFGCLGVCRVKDYHKSKTPAGKNEVITGREKNKLGGTVINAINEEYMYAKIIYKEDDYYFQYSDSSSDKLYIAPKGYTDAIRVVSLKMGDREVEQYHYSIGEDEVGMYILLKRKNIYIDAKYTCSPEAVIEIGGFVYAPLNVTSRPAIGINASDKRPIEAHKTREQLAGEYVQDLNLACSLRRVGFYIDYTDFSGAGEIRFYLNEKAKNGRILFIRAAGKLIHSYAVQKDEDEREWVVDGYEDYYVDIKTSFLKEITGGGECAVEIEYITEGESEIDLCDVYGFYGGANDTRVFLAGNKNYPSRDYESGAYEGSYFPALRYTGIGDEYSKILGYGRFFSYQLIFKEDLSDAAMYFRLYDENGYSIKKGTLLQSAVSKNAVENVNSHLFVLSREGLFSIESTQIEGQSKSVLRSKAVNELLLFEDMENLKLAKSGGKLLILAKKRVYVLDIDAGYVWYIYSFNKEIDAAFKTDRTEFVCKENIICRKEEGSSDLYTDDYGGGEKYNVCAYWKTNNVCFTPFSPRDVISAYCVAGDEFLKSGAEIYYDTQDYKDRLALKKNSDLFSFGSIDFSRFSFAQKNKGKELRTHIRAKRAKKFSMTVKNNNAEGFKICGIGFLYR